MRKTVPIRTQPEIQSFLKRLREWNQNYYMGALIGIQWGIRCSDILALTVDDVLAGTGKRVQIIDRIEIKEIKTGHERTILITDDMKDELYMHIKGMGKNVDRNCPLVLSRNRNEFGECKPISRQRLWAVLKQVADELGIKGPIGTHSLRKTWAFQVWQKGVRIDVIQKEFGHASVATTHRYACIPDESRDALYEKINFARTSRRKSTSNRNG